MERGLFDKDPDPFDREPRAKIQQGNLETARRWRNDNIPVVSIKRLAHKTGSVSVLEIIAPVANETFPCVASLYVIAPCKVEGWLPSLW